MSLFRFARILEKQNSLQMSQVFPLRASLIRWALLFKDSIGGTEETDKVTGCPRQLNMHAQFKNRTLPAARGIARLLTHNKLRSRGSEAASPNPCCSYAALLPLHLTGLRRGLASFLFTQDETSSVLVTAGFTITAWNDVTIEVLNWIGQQRPPTQGFNLGLVKKEYCPGAFNTVARSPFSE